MTSQKRVYLFLLNLISKLCRWKGLDLRSKILKNVRCHDHYISSYSKLNVFFAAPRNLLNHTDPLKLIILLLFSTVLSMRLFKINIPQRNCTEMSPFWVLLKIYFYSCLNAMQDVYGFRIL